MYLIYFASVYLEYGPERVSGMEMDEQRKQHMAYEYLCHLEEAKVYVITFMSRRGKQTLVNF